MLIVSDAVGNSQIDQFIECVGGAAFYTETIFCDLVSNWSICGVSIEHLATRESIDQISKVFCEWVARQSDRVHGLLAPGCDKKTLQ